MHKMCKGHTKWLKKDEVVGIEEPVVYFDMRNFFERESYWNTIDMFERNDIGFTMGEL